MAQKEILVLLQGGDRRSTGRSDQVAAMVSQDRGLFPRLIECLWSDDPLVRMRAADATEKVTRKNRDLLQSYKSDLLALMAETTEQELRWHLAVMVPRLTLDAEERHITESLLKGYLQDRSSIVRTFALQGLADLAQNDPRIRSEVLLVLRDSSQNGTPAMKARSRKLLLQLKHA